MYNKDIQDQIGWHVLDIYVGKVSPNALVALGLICAKLKDSEKFGWIDQETQTPYTYCSFRELHREMGITPHALHRAIMELEEHEILFHDANKDMMFFGSYFYLGERVYTDAQYGYALEDRIVSE